MTADAVTIPQPFQAFRLKATSHP